MAFRHSSSVCFFSFTSVRYRCYAYFAVVLVGLLLVTGVCGERAESQLNRYYYYTRTQKMLARGDYFRALATINVFLEHQPDDYISLYFRALAKYSLEDYYGACSDLDHLLTQRPFMVEALRLRSAARNQRGMYDSALTDIALAIDLRPNDEEAIFYRGVTYFLQERYGAAIDDFTQVLQSDPKRLDARVNRGIAYVLDSSFDAAEQDFLRAAQSHPFSAVPYLHLAQFEYGRSNHSQALAYVDEVLRIEPNSGRGYFLRSLAQYGLGMPDSALASMTHSIQLAPRNSLALYNRGLMYAERKEWNAALMDLMEARRISPTNLFIIYNYALVQYELGRLWRAIDGLTDALGLYPRFAQGYAMRSRLYVEVGELELAQHDLDSAQRLRLEYESGRLDQMLAADSASGRFNQMIAFEADFTPQQALLMPFSGHADSEILPLACVALGQRQNYQEWLAVSRVDSICGGPFFALTVPRDDSLAFVDVSLLPPLRNGHAVTLFEGIDRLRQYDYDSAIAIVRPLEYVDHFSPVAKMVRACALVGQSRYDQSPSGPTSLVLVGPVSRRERASVDYSEPLALLEELQKRYPTPYIDYNIGVIHYLSRDLDKALAAFDGALNREPDFAEALYNRGLVRLLLGDRSGGCADLSRAGELGLDIAYRAIAQNCNR